jgi:hypothetical protein
MNTPPIPPKSEYFFEIQNDPYQRNGVWFSLPYIRYFSHDSDFPMLVEPQNGNDGDVSDDERPIIASVAEVEWRKRAERWHALADKNILNPSSDKVRTGHFVQRAVRAEENAEAWRAWGEQ